MLRPALGVSLAFLNRFSSEYFDLSVRVGARGGYNSSSCPADRSLRGLVERGGDRKIVVWLGLRRLGAGLQPIHILAMIKI